MTPAQEAGVPRALRVAHAVRSDGFAGVERYITYIGPLLAARGCDVVVIGGDEARMVDALDRSPVRYLPARTTMAVARRLSGCGRLDVVHAHMTSAELASVGTAWRTHGRIVATRHFAARRGSSAPARAAAVVVRHAVWQEIAISRFVGASIENAAIVIPNGVPSRNVTPGAERVVVMAQRLETEKDVDVGLRGWSASGLATEGWRMLVAGQGQQRAALEVLAEKLGVAESVTFMGSQPGLEPLLARAGVFLATARAEPLGLSVLEAMSFAVPVVASASGGHLETVGRSAEPSLFPPGDHLSCASQLRRLAHDGQRRRAYGRELREIQQQHFDLDMHVDRLLEVYASAAGR